MRLHSKQSSLFSFYALPSGGKSKDAVVHWHCWASYLLFVCWMKCVRAVQRAIWNVFWCVHFISKLRKFLALASWHAETRLKNWTIQQRAIWTGIDPWKVVSKASVTIFGQILPFCQFKSLTIFWWFLW